MRQVPSVTVGNPRRLRACLATPPAAPWGGQTAVCGILDSQHIPEYASDLRPCIHPFAPPPRTGLFKQTLSQ